MFVINKKIIRFLVFAAIVILLFTVLTLCGCGGRDKIQLKVFHADSLTIPFQEIEKQFELKYPNVDVQLDGHGSIQVIRAVTELHEDVDVATVADSQLIPLLMYNTQIAEDKGPFARWYIDFAGNTLGIAYTDRSPYASEINADNWYEILTRPDVKVGLADARIDSLGYRVLMAVQLAESYYRDDTIFERFFDGAFTMSLDVSYADGAALIKVPQLYKSEKENIVLRGYSLQLLGLIESGDIDYTFEYESVSRQHNLNFLTLPAEFNMSSQEYDAYYQKVDVVLDFQRFASVNPKFRGAPIVYGVTIPENALHPEEAIDFIRFLFGPDGQKVLTDNYQPFLVPPEANNAANVPNDIMQLIK
jgi:molybdate/tungstate transport system substrate-binding protein